MNKCLWILNLGKFHPRTGHESPGADKRYSSTLSLTSALDWGGWSTSCSGRFTPGMTRYPFYRKLGGPQGRSGRVRKILPPPGFDPWTVNLVASRYTDYAILAHCLWILAKKEDLLVIRPIECLPAFDRIHYRFTILWYFGWNWSTLIQRFCFVSWYKIQYKFLAQQK
jgi:hypothetical protein